MVLLNFRYHTHNLPGYNVVSCLSTSKLLLFAFYARTHSFSENTCSFFLTWIFWVGTPVVGPPTSLQYKSNLGVPLSSSPQVAVAEILAPSARLKYGGFKLNPVKSLKVPCPAASRASVSTRITNAARRWAPLIPLAMFHMRDPSRCWEQPAARRSCHP